MITVLKYNFKPLKTCKKIYVYYQLSNVLSGWTSFPLLSSHNHSCCICLLIIFGKLLFVSLSPIFSFVMLSEKSHI